MQVPVVMPQLGLTMTEGAVSEWLKKPGDDVKRNEIIFVVSTDKADMEVESTDTGTLATIVVEKGKMVPVGTVIAYLESSGVAPNAEAAALQASTQKNEEETIAQNNASAASTSVAETNSTSHPSPFAAARRDGPPASPRARRLAKELGIDISTIQSRSSRVVEDDVRRAAATSTTAPSSTTNGVDTNRRRIIAEKLTESVLTIPHFSVAIEANAQHLIDLYEGLKTLSSQSVKLSLTDMLMKALALAVHDMPDANATWINGAVVRRTSVELGLAIATDRGVVGPTMRDADRSSLAQIASQRTDLIDKAQRGRLAISDLEGAVGTLSNLGMFGIDEFQGIITPGQTFILAAGRIQERPWIEKHSIVIRPTLKLNLSMDHRVADGVTAARLAKKFAELVESPYRIIAGSGATQAS
jgi:pyruvate dehydrogenase E2 component (dihydrolipoamide acetyltransferase)